MAEVSVSGQPGGIFEVPAGTGSPPTALLRRRRGRPYRERVTWQRAMPDSALRNDRSIWGGPGDLSYSVESAEEAVDLEFIRGLPADSVFDLSVGSVHPGSFAAVAHLAPGLRRLGVYLDNLGADAPARCRRRRWIRSGQCSRTSSWASGRTLDEAG